MTFIHPRTFLPTLVLASAALAWGCTRPPAVVVDDGKSRALEARVAKLEQDVKAVAAARDGLQQKLAAAEELASQLDARATQLETQLAAAELERDSARAGLKARTAERDATLAQYDSFRKNIRELLGQADTTASSLPVPLVTTISLPTVPRGGL